MPVLSHSERRFTLRCVALLTKRCPTTESSNVSARSTSLATRDGGDAPGINARDSPHHHRLSHHHHTISPVLETRPLQHAPTCLPIPQLDADAAAETALAVAATLAAAALAAAALTFSLAALRSRRELAELVEESGERLGLVHRHRRLPPGGALRHAHGVLFLDLLDFQAVLHALGPAGRAWR